VTWKAIVRPAIGVSHEKQGMPCQDYGDYGILNNVIVGAVADGAGSAKYSDVGAKLVVESVVNHLLQVAKRIQRQKCTHCPSQALSQERAEKLFTKTVSKARATLQQQADDKDYSITELACTLLVFVATPQWVAAMQIGDGFIVTRAQEDSEYQLLFRPDKGEFANETTFVTSANAISEMQVKVLPGKSEFICASTDGLEKLAIRILDWTPFPPFFQPLEEYLQESDYLDYDIVYNLAHSISNIPLNKIPLNQHQNIIIAGNFFRDYGIFTKAKECYSKILMELLPVDIDELEPTEKTQNKILEIIKSKSKKNTSLAQVYKKNLDAIYLGYAYLLILENPLNADKASQYLYIVLENNPQHSFALWQLALSYESRGTGQTPRAYLK
jgi:tetratricopeptide (TPR) repeat protein